MIEISNTTQNQSLVLFVDDATTIEADGLAEGEIVAYKLYRASTGEEFELNVSHKLSMENSTGLYYSDSFAGIAGITTSTTSISEMNGYEVQLYPNPAKDFVMIKFGAEVSCSANVSIFNAQGSIVKQMIVETGQSQMDVGSLEQGIYFVRIQNAEMNKTVKLIIE